MRQALGRILAMRDFMREQRIGEMNATDQMGNKPAGEDDFAVNNWAVSSPSPTSEQTEALAACGLTPDTAYAMYRLLAIARFEDRFVVPTTRREWADNVEKLKGDAGFPESIS